jgi:CBS domain-containing protein
MVITDAENEIASRDLGRSLAEGLAGVPFFLARTVSDIARAVPRVSLEAGAEDAAAALGEGPGTEGDCVIVTGSGGEAVGLVTPGDLVRRCPPEGPAGVPVYEVMTAPLTRLSPDAPVTEALELMRNSKTARIVLRDPPGSPGRTVGAADLLGGLMDAMWVLREDIRAAASVPELQSLRRRFPQTAALALAGGQNAPEVLRGLSELSDLVTGAAVDLTVRDLGPPPGRFVFLALGSEGRREHIPGADQDNALVYIPPSDDSAGRASAEEYFRRLAEELCRRLEALGLPRCPGGVMASNPAWRADLDTWKDRIRKWITLPDSAQVLGISTFLDFRPQGGDPEIAETLRSTLDGLIAENPELLLFLARNIVQTALPGLPRAGVLRDIMGDGGLDIDIKALMAPIAGYARLQSLRRGLRCTGTLPRLSALKDIGVVKEADYREMKEAYEFLLGLRLFGRLNASDEDGAWGGGDAGGGSTAHNGRAAGGGRVPLSGLSQAEDARLRHAASQASLAQKALSFEFLGSSV